MRRRDQQGPSSPPGYTGALGRLWQFPETPASGFFRLGALSLAEVGPAGQSNPALSAWEGSAGTPSTELMGSRPMDTAQRTERNSG